MKPMKPTTIYLLEKTDANLQRLATQTGKSMSEIIQELIEDNVKHK